MCTSTDSHTLSLRKKEEKKKTQKYVTAANETRDWLTAAATYNYSEKKRRKKFHLKKKSWKDPICVLSGHETKKKLKKKRPKNKIMAEIDGKKEILGDFTHQFP